MRAGVAQSARAGSPPTVARTARDAEPRRARRPHLFRRLTHLRAAAAPPLPARRRTAPPPRLAPSPRATIGHPPPAYPGPLAHAHVLHDSLPPAFPTSAGKPLVAPPYRRPMPPPRDRHWPSTAPFLKSLVRVHVRQDRPPSHLSPTHSCEDSDRLASCHRHWPLASRFPGTTGLFARQSALTPLSPFRRASWSPPQPLPLPPPHRGPRPPLPRRHWLPLPILPETLDYNTSITAPTQAHFVLSTLFPTCSPIRSLELQVVCVCLPSRRMMAVPRGDNRTGSGGTKSSSKLRQAASKEPPEIAPWSPPRTALGNRPPRRGGVAE